MLCPCPWHLRRLVRSWGKSPQCGLVVRSQMKGYGLDPAQMQLQGGRHLIMELKAAGWRRVWEIIKGARPEILDGLVKRILVEEAKNGCIE